MKLSDSAVLHLGVTAEAGVDSNVFYQNINKVDSPVIRIIPFVEITNQARNGTTPDGAYYNLTASLLYREYASSDERVKAQRAFNPTVSGVVEFGSRQSLSFGLSNSFSRSEEPPYGASNSAIQRNYNMAAAQLRWTPNGGRLSSTLRYTNAVDLFDNEDLRYANSMRNDLLLDVSWKWLPKTAAYLQAQQGYVSYLNDTAPSTAAPVPMGVTQGPTQPKQDALPLHVMTGLRGLLTEKLTFNLGVGYANGFYRGQGTNPTGWGNLMTVVEGTYRPTMRTQATLGYVHEYRNSIIGNFYNVDGVYGSLGYTLAGRFVTTAFARYEYRRFFGAQMETSPLVVGRKDATIQAGASADYFIQRWFFAGVFYVFSANRSNLPATTQMQYVGLDYDKHMVLGHIGVTY